MKIADGIYVIPEFLNLSKCASLIKLSEEYGYEEATVSLPGKAQMMKGVRNNDRVIFEDSNLADQLFSKVRTFIPEIYNELPPHSLNERFRFYRYTPNQRFKRHIDGVQTSGDRKSRVTMLMYLNDDLEGGETIFREKGVMPGSNDEYIISPEAGMALLFRHKLWHEGAPVKNGSKYVLRTDVFYNESD